MAIRGFLVNVDTHIAAEVELEPNLDNYYDLLGGRAIDITTRRIGGRLYDIVCDDESLLKDNPKVSAIDRRREPMLAGSLLVVGFADDEGRETSLAPDDVVNIRNSLVRGIDGRPILVCEYDM